MCKWFTISNSYLGTCTWHLASSYSSNSSSVSSTGSKRSGLGPNGGSVTNEELDLSPLAFPFAFPDEDEGLNWLLADSQKPMQTS